MMRTYFMGSRRREEADLESGSYRPPRYLGGYSLLLALCLATNIALAAQIPPRRGMVSSVNPLATEAGLNVLKSGGNAIDAAVAVGFTLGVVDTHNSGIGGGCFMLIRLANGKFVAIDGREMAPAAATRDMFIREGRGDTELSQTGALASGVPGEVAVFDYAVKKHGKKKLSELILPAAEIAENGFVVTSSYASRLRSVANDLARFEASRAIFLKDGKPLVAGDVLKQVDLAATYRAIAERGSDWFYRGPFAQATEKWMKANGGIMTAADFAHYRIALREPVETSYRGSKVVSFPPPSSGGVHLVQMLNILEKFDLKSLDEVTRLHVIAEAMKLAFADRAYWLGDPDHAKVPRGLVAKKYAATLAKRINLERVTSVPSHGVPPGAQRDFFKQQPARLSSMDAGTFDTRLSVASLSPQWGEGLRVRGENVPNGNESLDPSTSWVATTPHPDPLPVEGRGDSSSRFGLSDVESASALNEKHTTHWSVADADGNWVACTATVNTTYGSKVVIPGTGVVMNNEMDDFSVQPGVPNAFGLIGAEANAVGPGKRPLSSMTPTIVLKRGKPLIAVGAAGGPKIISAVLQELIGMLDLGLSPSEAMAAPRIHHQWSPDELMAEKSLSEDVKAGLIAKGHKVKELNSLSVSHLVARTPDGKSFTGAADPRSTGVASGW
jgi:gamma-glutamyltranspeptidase